jgi:hypothetical protein
MKLTTLLSVTLFTASQGVLAGDALLDEARSTTKQFGKALKSEVVKSMKASGPVGTITVCNERAPEIAKEVSTKSRWDIGRTSLKLRNPANAPDAWELAVLNSFEERKANGEPVKSLEYSEIVENDGAKTFRYMKAIPTGKPCLACHAAKIKPEVEENLARLYPEDKARGFKLGDIRGAFTLSKPL